MSSAAIESLKRKVPWGAATDRDAKLLICFIATCISKKGWRHRRLCLTLAWECLLVPGKALGTINGQVIEVQRTAFLLPLPGSPWGTHTYKL